MIAKRLCLLALLFALVVPGTSYAKKKKHAKKSHKPAPAAVYRTKSRKAAPPPADLQESAPPAEAAPVPAEPVEPAETVEPAPAAAPIAPSGKAERLKGNPLPYVQRNIVAPRGMLRVDGGPADFAFLSDYRGFMVGKAFGPMPVISVSASNNLPSSFVLGQFTRFAQQTVSNVSGASSGTDVGVVLGLGAGFGVIDKLEVGTLILPLLFQGGAHYAPIEFYGRYQILEGNFQLAAQAGIWIPTYSGTAFGLDAGAPMLIRLGNRMRLDTGAMFKFSFASGHTGVGLNIPAALNFALTDQFFVGGRTGIGVADFSSKNTFYIPLGIQGGMTIAQGMLDLLAWFQWPALITGVKGNEFTASGWQLGVGATFWMQLL